jgi:hypothetical protein
VLAVKVLTADLEPDNVERAVREQAAMGILSGHPTVVTIFQVGTTATKEAGRTLIRQEVLVSLRPVGATRRGARAGLVMDQTSRGEQYPTRRCGSQHCCAVTAQGDHTVEPAQLQPVLQREPEAVRPMEQGKHTDAEENKFGQRIPYDCQQVSMVRRVEDPQRKRQPEKEQQHR